MAETTQEPIAAIAGQCLHYTGVYGPGVEIRTHCSAGVEYRALVNHEMEPGWFIRLPCMTRDPRCDWMPDDPAQCSKLELPNDDQVDEYETWFETHFAKMMEAIKGARVRYNMAVDYDRQTGRIRTGDFEDKITCPKCSGTLHFIVKATGGHDGQCETDDCIMWRSCNSTWARG